MANHTYSKKGKFGTTMGVTSIIAILVILVLIVFSALSYTTSKADYSLAQKTSRSTTSYYHADMRAEEKAAEAKKVVDKGEKWQDDFSVEGCVLTDTADGTKISYAVEIDTERELAVELLVSHDGSIVRDRWQVIPTSEWEPDTSLPVMQ